ncbi:MAG TPA: hypothetical protein VF678_04915 [bacterium]
MMAEKTKREIKDEIEAARKRFLASGRKMARLSPEPLESADAAKPRKQRLKMYA